MIRYAAIGGLTLVISGCLSLENLMDRTRAWVEADTLHLSGTMNAQTYDEVAGILADNPQLTRVEIGEIDGSIDDDVNLQTGLLIHAAGLDTHLRADSFIESGGVDIFCAGRTRTAERGVHVGVHAWAYNDNSRSGFRLDKLDEDHKPYIDYFETVGCPLSFYWFTIEAAPADGMYIMSEQDLIDQGVVTDFVD